MSIASNEVAVRDSNSPVVDRRNKFAVGIAFAMLSVNLVGFAPTLYLRPLFDPPPIPAYLYAHGVFGTAWFVLVLVQTLLVAKRRLATHRVLGWIGAALAVAVLVSGIVTSANMVPRNVALGLTSEADIALYEGVTAADNAAFIVFPTLVLLGVLFRRRRDIHMRFMLLSAASIIGPAAARIGSWFGPIPNPVSAALIFGCLLAFVAHDLWSRRRLHWATAVGVALFVGMTAGMRLSGYGAALVEQRLQEAQSTSVGTP